MIIGSGLLASSFANKFQLRGDVCVYAAGVSNSSCVDQNEFDREEKRLSKAIKSVSDVDKFIYFGTCSVADPDAKDTKYVQHKLAMEKLVTQHPGYIIFRLPQLAGHTPNPHTLLNFLYSRVVRSEAFSIWRHAYRNIIDVDDVATLAGILIENQSNSNSIINLANPKNYSILEIVNEMENVVEKKAIYDIKEKGQNYTINVVKMLSILPKTGVCFNSDYLNQVLRKYYDKA